MSATFHVRSLLAMTEPEIKNLPTGHVIIFDDGFEMKSSTEETLYSYWFWELFKPYPATKVLKKHHLRHILGGKSLNKETHTKLCSNILESVVEENGLFLPESKEPILKRIYQRISYAMTRLSFESEENVAGLDILDFIQIAKHPEIESLRQEAIADQNKIKYGYDNALKLIETDPLFWDNGLAKAVRAKIVKPNQVMQCVVYRGIMSEVDGAIYKKPNWSNYTLGNTSLYQYVGDSRTAAKSHFYSDAALQDSEYMARKFQLFTTVVEKIAYEDCHSTKYMEWLIGPKKLDKSGTVIYGGDLPLLIGKNYLDEASGTLKTIEGNEEHLVGKTIKFRSALYCTENNPHYVCYVCAGKLSQNISRFANIGHLGAVTTTKDLTQSILSIKHVNTSSVVTKILLKDHERAFMNTGTDGAAFYFNKEIASLMPNLSIMKREAVGLVGIEESKDVAEVSLPHVSELTRILLTSEGGTRDIDVVLDVTQKNKPSMLSREMLYYLKTQGYKTNADNCFVCSLENWDYSQPAFVMPNKEESYVELAAAVESLVRSSKKMVQKRIIKDAPAMLLRELFDLVNSKMRINILSFEIVVYALMVESDQSYAMGRNVENPVLGIAEPLTKYRSLGQALAYEKQNDTLTDPLNFIQGSRPDSPMDVFLAPREAVAHYQAKMRK